LYLVPRLTCNGTVLIAVDYIAVVPRRVHSGNPTPSPKRTARPLGALRFPWGGRVSWSFAPILLGFPLRSRRIRVLHFEPIRRAPGTVVGILALRDDAFEAHLAGVGEDGRAVALEVLIEADAEAGLGHDRCERGLADLKRITPEIVAVLLDRV